MSTFDELKGKAEKAAGDLTDDKDLKRDGQTDEAAGSIKSGIAGAKDKASDAVDDLKDRLK